MGNKGVTIQNVLLKTDGTFIRYLAVGGKWIAASKVVPLNAKVEQERTDDPSIWSFSIDPDYWKFFSRTTFDDPDGKKTQIGVKLDDNQETAVINIIFYEGYSTPDIEIVHGATRDDSMLDRVNAFEDAQKKKGA